jgi:hypothetical protein
MRVLLDRRPLLDVSVRRSNPTIPHTLEAIVAKCLAFALEDRYPNAHALATDLDRFLEHQQPIYARNPSRLERVGDSLHRAKRQVARRPRTLAAVAACLMLAALFQAAAWLVRPVIDWFKSPLEQVRSFQAAVADIENNRFDQAIIRLRPLDWWYPESSLFKIYLSIALDRMNYSASSKGGSKLGVEPVYSMNRAVDAESYFRAALSDPNLPSRLKSWARNHPRLAPELEDFGVKRFDRARTLLEKIAGSKKTPHALEEQAEEDVKHLYALVERALQLALELNPDLSQKSLRTLAIVEERNGNFRSAYERTSSLIDAAMSVYQRVSPLRDQVEQARAIRNELYSTRTVRSRIAIKWAGQLHSQGGSRALQVGRDLMDRTLADLNWCNEYLMAGQNKNATSAYFILGNKAPALLTLGEIEMDLGLNDPAAEHLRSARLTIDQLTELTTRASLPPAKDVSLWIRRVEDGLRRLRPDELSPKVTLEQSRHQ